MVSVRPFAADEWSAYKALRLSALAESPDAFGSTFAAESGRPEGEWASRLEAGVASGWDLPLVAEQDGRPIGLAWCRIEAASPAVASLYQVWVAPESRRLGAGQMLVEAAIAWAVSKQAHSLELHVTCGDSPARRLYARHGFEPVGQPEPIRPGSGLLEQKMRIGLEPIRK
jgi:GNAT superfamily N-acetyltransferase